MLATPRGALRAGALGFLVKDTAPEQLIAAVHQVAGGAVVLGDGVVDRVVAEMLRTSPAEVGLVCVRGWR